MDTDLNRTNTRLVPVLFEYLEPRTLQEALSIMEARGGDVAVLAGGTDLLVRMKQRFREPSSVVNIKKISSLAFIKDEPPLLRIGSATKLIDIEQSDTVASHFPILHQAVSVIGSIQIRVMATLGGNLCNASPAADGSVALLALDSMLGLVSARGTRTVPISQFFLGPGKTVLEGDELLSEIRIPHLPAHSGTAFLRIARTDMDLAKVNVAIMMQLRKGITSTARIALGAVAPTPIRAKGAEELLTGQKLTDSLIEEAAAHASTETKPITDVRSTAEYRRHVSAVLVGRALKLARERAERVAS